LREPVPPLSVTQELTWRINYTQAAFQAKARLTATDGVLALAEWHVPESVVVTNVSGRNVWNWSHKGSRLQAWLQQAGSQAEIEFTGWSSIKADDNGITQGSKEDPASAGQILSFNLPAIHPLGVRVQTTSLRILPGPGLACLTRQAPNLL